MALFTHAQTPHSNSSRQVTTDSILTKRGVLYFSFSLPSTLSVHQISKIISVDNMKAGKIRAYANRLEMARFLLLDIDYAIEQQTPQKNTLKSVQKSFTSWNQYPTYEQYDSLMHHYQTVFPGLCKLVEIGKSVQGRSLYYMRLGNQPLYHRDKPEIMFSGCMHGD